VDLNDLKEKMQLIIQGQTVEGAEDSEEDEDESKKR